jgi:hypothetical protein
VSQNQTAAHTVRPAATVSVPDQVVHRRFAAETVLLNLQTGQYHGVNPTGGRMLELLEQGRTIAETAAVLADEYGRPMGELQDDVADFCAGLAERGLIQIDAAHGR